MGASDVSGGEHAGESVAGKFTRRPRGRRKMVSHRQTGGEAALVRRYGRGGRSRHNLFIGSYLSPPTQGGR